MRFAQGLTGWLVMAAIVAAVPAVPASAQQGLDLFQQALTKERAAGDLDAAIALYARVVKEHADDRALAARALMRMAGCYDQLGSPEARRIYQRVVNDFADQSEAAAEARRRLQPTVAPPPPPPPGLVTGKRQPLGRIVRVPAGVLSPNGRFVALRIADSPGDLVVQEISTGRNRSVLQASGAEGACGQTIWSRDSARIAFGWCRGAALELKIVGLSDGQPRPVPIRGLASMQLLDWSSDGKSILAILRTAAPGDQLAVISSSDGSVRILRTADSGSGRPQPGAVKFSPDGRFVVYTPASGSRAIQVLGLEDQSERPLFSSATADLFVGFAGDGRVVFTADRLGTFDLWAVAFSNGRAQGIPVRLVEDIGPVTSLGLTDNGALFYTTAGLMPGGTADLYVAQLDPATGRAIGPATPVSRNGAGHLSHPVWSPDGSELAYKVAPAGTAGRIFVQSLRTGEERVVDADLGTTGQFDWSPDGRSLIVACVRDNVPQIVRVDRTTNALSIIVAGNASDAALATSTPGRGPLSQPRWMPDSRSIVYVTGSRIEWRDLDSGRQRTITDAEQNVQSLALAPDGSSVAFIAGAALMTATVADGKPHLLMSLRENTSAKLVTWSRDSQYVVFADRTAAMTVPETTQPYSELWRIRASGGAPERLNIAGVTTFQPAISPDGRYIAFTVASDSRPGVHVIEGLFRR